MAHLTARGKITHHRNVIAVRSIVRDDLQLLKVPRESTPVLQRLRDPHHRVARLVASGLRLFEVAERSGYSYNRVQQLTQDPAFKQLVAEKRKEVTKAWLEAVDDYHELAVSNMLKAERQIAEKLEEADENNETLPTRDLIAISRDAADRFGYGKKTTNTNINIDFAARLEKARVRSGKVIDAVGTSVALSPQLGEAPSARYVEPPSSIRRF